jgi:hypothetical protein
MKSQPKMKNLNGIIDPMIVDLMIFRQRCKYKNSQAESSTPKA